MIQYRYLLSDDIPTLRAIYYTLSDSYTYTYLYIYCVILSIKNKVVGVGYYNYIIQ